MSVLQEIKQELGIEGPFLVTCEWVRGVYEVVEARRYNLAISYKLEAQSDDCEKHQLFVPSSMCFLYTPTKAS